MKQLSPGDKIRIVKKQDEFSAEYQVGDVFSVEGTWYGGVHVTGKTGVPLSLDREEYEPVCQELAPAEKVPEGEGRFQKTYTQDTGDGGVEIWLDTQTGVSYLFRQKGPAAGLTPLLGPDGTAASPK